ncbi:helix-turn-helix domain-containing protein [Streptomyces sp. NPDC087226]|uniref:helix-turn-helix domain-containing protein n=1 Tax=Streptomyces sp. NPDC087226 TaxID=3365771 RepID=UPI0037F688A1
MTGGAPECVALAEGLRAVRARTGLSLVALAERTAYSKSSWERYLNGKKPVPRQAVEALCTTAGEPPGRLLALWELADAEWSGRARLSRPAAQQPSVAVPTDAGSGGAVPRRTRRGRWPTLVAGAAAALAAVTAALAVPDSGAGEPTVLTASPALDPPPACHGTTCDGMDPGRSSCGLPGRADSLGPPQHTRTGTGVEIRYSSVCAAAWGRIWHAKVGDVLELSVLGVRPRRVVIDSTADTDVYRFTAMIGAPDRAGLRLCFTAAGETDPECFHA